MAKKHDARIVILHAIEPVSPYAEVYGASSDTFKKKQLEGVDEVYLAGLVQEVCIKENALAALGEGYKVTVIEDATAPFDRKKGVLALEELKKKGAKIADLEEVIERVN